MAPGSPVYTPAVKITPGEAREILLDAAPEFYQRQEWINDQFVGGKGGFTTVLFVGLFSALGGALFGMDIGYISGVLEANSFLEDLTGGRPLNDASTGFMTGIFALGAIVAAFPSILSRLTSRLGRKGCVILGGSTFCAGAGLQGLAPSLSWMYLGRFIAGAAVGVLSATIPIYQGEIAPPSARGMIVALYQLAITAGILLAFWLNYVMINKEHGWRYCILLQLIPGLLLSAGAVLVPRSPRWLVSKGRHEAAVKVLLSVRPPEEDIRIELAQIYQECARECSSGKPTWGEFLSGTSGKLLIIGVTLQIVQQMCGLNMFMYYGPKIFADIFHDQNASFKFQFLSGVVNMLATIPAIVFVDRAGRRILLALSAAGMAVCCVVLATVGTFCLEQFCSTAGGTEECSLKQVCGAWSQYTVVGSVLLFIANFAYGWGPVIWIYCAEIYSLKFRTKANGMTTDANWVGNFLIGYLPPFLLSKLHFSTFWIFAAINCAGFLMAMALPETKGKSLETIQLYFDNYFDRSFCGTAKRFPSEGNSENSMHSYTESEPNSSEEFQE